MLLQAAMTALLEDLFLFVGFIVTDIFDWREFEISVVPSESITDKLEFKMNLNAVSDMNSSSLARIKALELVYISSYVVDSDGFARAESSRYHSDKPRHVVVILLDRLLGVLVQLYCCSNAFCCSG